MSKKGLPDTLSITIAVIVGVIWLANYSLSQNANHEPVPYYFAMTLGLLVLFANRFYSENRERHWPSRGKFLLALIGVSVIMFLTVALLISGISC